MLEYLHTYLSDQPTKYLQITLLTENKSMWGNQPFSMCVCLQSQQ